MKAFKSLLTHTQSGVTVLPGTQTDRRGPERSSSLPQTQQFKGRGSPGGCARKFPQGDSRTVSVNFLKQHPPELASPLGLGSVLSNNS